MCGRLSSGTVSAWSENIKSLVDSGASVTLMEKDLWECISKNHLQKLGAYNISGLVGVQGSSLTIHGCVTVNLQLSNL